MPIAKSQTWYSLPLILRAGSLADNFGGGGGGGGGGIFFLQCKMIRYHSGYIIDF